MVSDASDDRVEAVISHILPEGSEKAIAHSSKSLTPTERKYSQIEKEALAIIFAVKKFHKMLYGRHFTVITDYMPLISIFGSKKGIPVYTTNRLQRWTTMLLDYNLSIKYQLGRKIGPADALSRLTSSNQKAQEHRVLTAISVEPEVISGLVSTVRALPVTSEMLQSQTQYYRKSYTSTLPAGQIYSRTRNFNHFFSGDLPYLRPMGFYFLLNRDLKQFHYGHQDDSVSTRIQVLAKHGQTGRGTC